MSFSNYSELVDTIARWMARDDLGDDIGDAVYMTECELQRSIKFELADSVASGTTIANQEYIELPDDFAEPVFLRWDSTLDTDQIRVGSMFEWDRISKRPTRTTGIQERGRVGMIWGGRLYISPERGGDPYSLFYKAGIRHLAPDTPSNRILEEYPDALLYGALVQLAPFVGADERMATWQPLYQNAKEEARMAEWRKRTGHGPLTMRPDVEVW